MYCFGILVRQTGTKCAQVDVGKLEIEADCWLRINKRDNEKGYQLVNSLMLCHQTCYPVEAIWCHLMHIYPCEIHIRFFSLSAWARQNGTSSESEDYLYIVMATVVDTL